MASITTINSGDLISGSRADINNNFSNLNSDKIETSYLDTDTSLTANSDTKIATQKAVKSYVDSGGQQNASETVRGLVEEATSAEVAARTDVGATGAKLFVPPSKLPSGADVQTFTANGTWTKPTGAKSVYVKVIGGGASGGGRAGAGGGAGGGGGGCVIATFDATALTSTVAITVGAEVAGVTNANGNTGNNSTFGAYLTAYGGGAGLGTTNSGGGGGGGTFSVGLAGGGTTAGGVGGSPLGGVTAGGVSTFGGGGGGDGSASAGGVGGISVYGGGGGGGANTDGAGNGGNGGSSMYGGGGGGGSAGDTSGTAGVGGVSITAGAGGNGSNGNGLNITDGVAPGGGGGGKQGVSANVSGKGARGEIVVITY